jgi:hypothetical protein
MNTYLLAFKKWYELRQSREKLLVVALGWALIYSVFSLLLFRPLNGRYTQLTAEAKVTATQLQNLNTQIETINKIPGTPLYKEWVKHQKTLQSLQGQFKYLQQSYASKEWDDSIRTILTTHENVTIVEIKNLPETPYNSPLVTGLSKKIYQQKMLVTVNSNFNDTVDYLIELEKFLPNVHWDSLTYEVTNYPLAKVQMEFSILYEKTPTS